MKPVLLAIALFLPSFLDAQSVETKKVKSKAEEIIESEGRPTYCDDFPLEEYSVKGGSPPPLPKFPSQPKVCYKVQVAVLRKTDPFKYPLHQSLQARWRPCEQVWVVESKETFCDRNAAEKTKEELRAMGYKGCYLTQLVSYE